MNPLSKAKKQTRDARLTQLDRPKEKKSMILK
jgi:hypothetical protein